MKRNKSLARQQPKQGKSSQVKPSQVLLVEHSTKNTFSFADDYDDDDVAMIIMGFAVRQLSHSQPTLVVVTERTKTLCQSNEWNILWLSIRFATVSQDTCSTSPQVNLILIAGVDDLLHTRIASLIKEWREPQNWNLPLVVTRRRSPTTSITTPCCTCGMPHNRDFFFSIDYQVCLMGEWLEKVLFIAGRHHSPIPGLINTRILLSSPILIVWSWL